MDIREKIVIVIVCLVLALIANELTNDNVDDKTLKLNLYNECLTTDYDKFQCYSMIYGT